MILLLSAVSRANDCARALEQTSLEPVELCTNMAVGLAKLQQQEFSAVIVDELLLDSEPQQGEAIYKHLGAAVLVCSNFAIANVERVVREFCRALQRRDHELAEAKKHAAQSLRQELKDITTALLLSCELALKVTKTAPEAQQKMHELETLAKALSEKLAAAA
jgi:hypothetical protein